MLVPNSAPTGNKQTLASRDEIHIPARSARFEALKDQAGNNLRHQHDVEMVLANQGDEWSFSCLEEVLCTIPVPEPGIGGS